MRLIYYVRPFAHRGDDRTIDVSTVCALDTGRYETCVFDDHGIRPGHDATADYSPLSEVVAVYPDAATAAIGHAAVVAALTYALQRDRFAA